jgi:monoterpene epsilon-lactone hydrolase
MNSAEAYSPATDARRGVTAAEFERIVGPAIPDVPTILVDLALRLRMKRATRTGRITADGLRQAADKLARAMERDRVPPFVTLEPTRLGPIRGEWIAVGAEKRAPVLYFHGGGFYMCSPRTHRPLTWRLARATRRRVCAIEYRKAPDHEFPAWVDDGVSAFACLEEQGYRADEILLAGDSAGGNIALAVTHRLRRKGKPLPGGLILFSPWADLGCEGESYMKNQRRDAMFNAKAVRSLGAFLTQGKVLTDVRDPERSPVHADLTGFPRMLIFAGSTEVFLDDARTVARRASAAGVEVELHIYRHMPHVFPLFAGVLPRAKAAFQTIARFAT